MFRNALMIGAATAAFAAIAAPACADNITRGVWYSAAFYSTPSALSGPPFAVGTNPPSGTTAPAPNGTSWTITLSSPATLTVTDLEDSGDQFQIYDNGALLGTTSTPCYSCSYEGENISAALADANFSHGVFTLGSGVNVLSGTFIGSVGYGDMAFEVSGVPEPAAWALMLLGFGGLGLGLRSRRALAANA